MATATCDDLLSEGCLTVAQAVATFGVGRSRLYEWMQDGTLPYSTASGRRLIPRRALKKLIASAMVGVGPNDE